MNAAGSVGILVSAGDEVVLGANPMFPVEALEPLGCRCDCLRGEGGQGGQRVSDQFDGLANDVSEPAREAGMLQRIHGVPQRLRPANSMSFRSDNSFDPELTE